MLDVLKSLIKDKSGQGMVEYGLVLGFLALGIIALIFIAARYSVEDLSIKLLIG
jgi:Flp pilus assembly pilin Flp